MYIFLALKISLKKLHNIFMEWDRNMILQTSILSRSFHNHLNLWSNLLAFFHMMRFVQYLIEIVLSNGKFHCPYLEILKVYCLSEIGEERENTMDDSIETHTKSVGIRTLGFYRQSQPCLRPFEYFGIYYYTLRMLSMKLLTRKLWYI